MSLYKLVITLIFFFGVLPCYCQHVPNSILDYHNARISAEKFDSISELPKFFRVIQQYAKKNCGKKLEILSPGNRAVVMRTIRKGRKINMLDYCLKSKSYYLIKYMDNGDPYHMMYLAVCEYKGNTVSNCFFIRNLYFKSISELADKIRKRAFENAIFCPE